MMFILGGVFSAQFGMSSVYVRRQGWPERTANLDFVATFFVRAVLLQYPIGWISDQWTGGFWSSSSSSALPDASWGCCWAMYLHVLLVSSFIIGGDGEPAYSLLIAHTNDFLALRGYGGASGGLLSSTNRRHPWPVVTGWMMGTSLGRGVLSVHGDVCRDDPLRGLPLDRPLRRARAGDRILRAHKDPTATALARKIAQEYAIESELDGLREKSRIHGGLGGETPILPLRGRIMRVFTLTMTVCYKSCVLIWP
jgi:hypothetical protein